jgi:4-hydroxy-3-polyprenylbenzoate decarboxylase
VASGSNAPRRMVVCPCSMGTLAAIAHGMSDNLIERAADVVIKEKGTLVLVPRESAAVGDPSRQHGRHWPGWGR